MLRDAWDDNAEAWITWARTPGHGSYWRFHRDAFLPLVPPPGRLTLDIGCGEGRVSRDLARLGHTVVGIDGSWVMASSASTHAQASRPVLVGDAAALPLPDAVADCVVAFMSLQDIDAMELAIAEAGRVLCRGGQLVIAMTHQANTAGNFEGVGQVDDPPFVIVGSWFERKALADTCERGGLTMTFHSEHRALSEYSDALADAGFMIERIREVGDPDPDDKWHRIPLFLHLRAVKCRASPHRD